MDPSVSKSLKDEALVFLKQGNAGECIRCLREALTATPDDDQCYSYLGAAYSAQKDWEQATKAFERALSLKPSCRAHYNFGLALEKSGRLEEACSHFATAVAVDSSYQTASEALERAKAALAQSRSEGDQPVPQGPPILNPQSDQDPNAVTVAYTAGSSPVWSSAEGLDFSEADARMSRQPGGQVAPGQTGPISKEQMDAEREAKWLEDQKRMTKAGLKYGISIGAVIYVALFFCQRNFFGNDLLARFAGGYGLFLVIGILGFLGAAMGAAVGYAVGLTGGGEGMGTKVGALAGMVVEPIKSIIAGNMGLADLLIAVVVGAVVGAIAGTLIGRMVDMSIGWD